MGIRTPHAVKARVLKEWIQGISRDQIAVYNEIGAGTVTSIIQQTKNNHPYYDLDLIRELALKLKKENLDLNYFAPAVRLKKVLDRLEMTEENVEAFLEEINIHCFKKNINKKDFISKIDEVWKIVKRLDVSIFNIPIYIQKLKKELSDLEKATMIKESQIKQKTQEYNTTIEDLKKYRLNKPLVDKINILESKLLDKDIENYKLNEELLECQAKFLNWPNSKSILESEFIDANKRLPENKPMDMEELSKITDEIYYHPGRNVDIIKLMRERYPNKFKEKNTNTD
jgi:DNA repair ATPase RecN